MSLTEDYDGGRFAAAYEPSIAAQSTFRNGMLNKSGLAERDVGLGTADPSNTDDRAAHDRPIHAHPDRYNAVPRDTRAEEASPRVRFHYFSDDSERVAVQARKLESQFRSTPRGRNARRLGRDR
ncbi:MAG: hypothetical protein ACLPVY_03740 [Acidimicrobiia bacterium]